MLQCILRYATSYSMPKYVDKHRWRCTAVVIITTDRYHPDSRLTSRETAMCLREWLRRDGNDVQWHETRRSFRPTAIIYVERLWHIRALFPEFYLMEHGTSLALSAKGGRRSHYVINVMSGFIRRFSFIRACIMKPFGIVQYFYSVLPDVPFHASFF